jgi:hypothetical protein
MLAASMVLLAVMHGDLDAAAPRWNPDRLAVAHSHNDYEQRTPLFDALRAGFASVEADVWSRDSELAVSHLPFLSRGNLEDLYLRPLQERVDRLGTVFGDGRPFYLWIDLKESRPELTEALHALLERYPMLTIFTDEAVVPGPVVAILTGDETAKARYTDGHRIRRACRDSNHFQTSDATADRRWTWYALPWDEVVGRDEPAPGRSAAYHRLRELTDQIHRLGRRLRLYEVPERSEAWTAAIAAGVDLVGTDRIESFQAFLRASRPELAWASDGHSR